MQELCDFLSPLDDTGSIYRKQPLQVRSVFIIYSSMENALDKTIIFRYSDIDVGMELGRDSINTNSVRNPMEIWLLVVILAAWFILNRWVLPYFGVST